MTTRTALRSGSPRLPLVGRLFESAARRLVYARLERLSLGRVTLVDHEGHSHLFGAGEHAPVATITITRPAAFGRIAYGGSLGAAEAYLQGDWTCDDLPALLRLFTREVELTDDLDGGGARLTQWLSRLGHLRRRNHRRGSRDNIVAHYDLSNEFFGLFLDETMTYSCAYFENDEVSLRDASVAKLDRLCRKLDLRPDDHLLEIGSGWGSMAMHAAETYGSAVTTTTISPAQAELARSRFAEAGLDDRIALLEADYRDLDGTYDKVVSIEMIEAVGHEFLPRYFAACRDRLKPDGLFALQAITMPDERYDQYLRTCDFIRHYVFPGSCCASLAAIRAAVDSIGGLVIEDVEDMGAHYAETLQRWRAAFLERRADARDLGLDDVTLRMWDYYLAYCEAAFAESYVNVRQIVLRRS